MFSARAAVPCFFCQTLRRLCTDRASSWPGRWSCDRGTIWPPLGASIRGRGGRRSRGNPGGVPLARFRRANFSTARGGQLPVKNYRKDLTANLTGLGGVRFSVLGGVRFSVKIRPWGGPIQRSGGVRFSVDNSHRPQTCKHAPSPYQGLSFSRRGVGFSVPPYLKTQ